MAQAMAQAMAHPMAHSKFYIFTRKKKRDLLTLTDQALKNRVMAAMFCMKLIPRLFVTFQDDGILSEACA